MIAGCLYRPLRGQARSHRNFIDFEPCAVPVGAGLPAKKVTPQILLKPILCKIWHNTCSSQAILP
ncbi:hypothetical protein D0894_07220 [Pseudomonas monteilii]|uniref:Uncharacterized protein n=1 Tax=Pseudomonas monteilii TaxID=76759 RepID=A0A399MAL1_9PSED|nr:hypothetical protein D0894_07220 [Pseudomonas monteilii]